MPCGPARLQPLRGVAGAGGVRFPVDFVVPGISCAYPERLMPDEQRIRTPGQLVRARGRDRQEDDGLALVRGQVLEQLPTLIPGPQRRVSGAAPATTDSGPAIGVAPAVGAPAGWLAAPVTRWAP